MAQSDYRFKEGIEPWLVSDALTECDRVPIFDGVCIYGAGDLGALALDYCDACAIPVLAVVDRSRTGSITSRSGRRHAIISPDSAEATKLLGAPIFVAIATLPFAPLGDQLRDAGWTSVFPFYNLTRDLRDGHPLRNGWSLGSVTSEEIDTAEWVCKQWADETSWRHYETFLAWHRDNSELSFVDHPIDPNERYAIPELLSALTARHGQLVDVGSHKGESVGRLTSAGVQFSEYVLIEPDEASRSYLLEARDTIGEGRRVSVLSDLVGDARRTSKFQDGLGYCSQVWAAAHRQRQMIPLDDLNLEPDFLKVHTEGTESDILRGARETVSRYRPCLAFSVYHRREGFHSDIAGPMRMFPGYRWYFRIHGYQGTGAFVYGIPERLEN